MNKTAIKNYAIWARNKLISDIEYKAGLMGITEKGIAPALPQSTNEVQFFDIGTKDYATVRGADIRQRESFIAAVRAKKQDVGYAQAFRFIVEKVAYTWFNRLVAIRFMEVNDYLPSSVRVLSSENPGKAEPDMVTRPFDTDISFTRTEEGLIMRLKDENKLDELFRWLFIKQCKKLHDVLPVLFSDEQGEDYLELLLTISFTDKDGVLWHLVHDIPEDDFNVEKEGQVEIIGWMYQYYNTEPKDQVFADLKKNIKISKDKIPAATQLFTPDWIVRYMVENSLGRLWVEGHPNEELKKNWKYYLEEAEQEPEVQAQLDEIRKEYAKLRPEEIKVIDPCMGSGHILVYLFVVLMQIYESQGWTQREAAQSIVQNNLYGLDIDERAAQLAYFAVMMKARQYDRRFLERKIEPHVYAIQESNDIDRSQLRYFGSALDEFTCHNAETQMLELLDTLHDAKEYGSILNVPDLDWDLLRQYTADFDVGDQMSMEVADIEQTQSKLQTLISLGQAMAQKYWTTCTNPPYMGASGMNPRLSQYIKDNYPDSKSDLFAVCIERGFQMLRPDGFESMITMESWMFLSSFEKMREVINNTKTIYDLVHMPYLGKGGTSLGINFGTDMAVIRNKKITGYIGTYDRIAYYETDNNGIPFEFPTLNKYYKHTTQDCFQIIPGAPIAYWVNNNTFIAFTNGIPLGNKIVAKHGLTTGNVNACLRVWYECNRSSIGFNINDEEQFKKLGYIWAPHHKGGAYRKWYGNNDFVVGYSQYYNDLMDSFPGHRHDNPTFYFKEGITWTDLTSGTLGARYSPKGFIFDVTGPTAFIVSGSIYEMLGFMCSKVVAYFMDIMNSTMHFLVGQMSKVPVLDWSLQGNTINEIVKRNIDISKVDWDSFETSWDFKRHPLI